MTSASDLELYRDVASRVRLWVKSAAQKAAICRSQGDHIGAEYATVRMQAYADAAHILESTELGMDPVNVLMNLVRANVTPHTWSLSNFDKEAHRYLRARMYQLVARTIDPDQPEIVTQIKAGGF